ncbi:MAG: hypothetical protein WKI04_15710 [Ferruginibacter sp.]
MYQIIAPTLFQNKICRLPGMGTLIMVPLVAETDFINSHIKAPKETIEFIAEEESDKGFNEFSAISELLKKNLDENGSFLLKGIGTFIKNMSGEIRFVPTPVDPIFSFSIPAQMINRQAASHAMLVGDQETTNVEMSEYYNGKQLLNDRWWVWAIVLGAIGTGVLFLYIYKNGFNGLGNVNY